MRCWPAAMGRSTKGIIVCVDHLFTDNDNIIPSTAQRSSGPAVQLNEWNRCDAFEYTQQSAHKDKQQNALFVNHNGFVFEHYLFFSRCLAAWSVTVYLCESI